MLIGLTGVVTLALLLLSKPIVALVFERGAFTADDTVLVASVQTMYLLHVPFFVVGMLYVRLISALRANRILLWGSAMNLAVHIALTWSLMRSLGVVGVALATSLMYMFSVAFLAFIGLRLLRRVEGEGA